MSVGLMIENAATLIDPQCVVEQKRREWPFLLKLADLSILNRSAAKLLKPFVCF